MRFQTTREAQEHIATFLSRQGKTKPHEVRFIAEMLRRRESSELEDTIRGWEQELQNEQLKQRDPHRHTQIIDGLRVWRATDELITKAFAYDARVPETRRALPREAQEEILFFEQALLTSSERMVNPEVQATLRDVSQCGFDYFCAIVELRQRGLRKEFDVKNRILKHLHPDLEKEKRRLLEQITQEHGTTQRLEQDIRAYESAQHVDHDWREKIKDLENDLKTQRERLERARIKYLALLAPEQREFVDTMILSFYSLQ